MNKLIAIVGVFLISAGLASAKDLKTYKASYDKQMEEIILSHGMQMTNLHQRYGKSLDAMLAKVKKAGDLDKTTAVMNELERFRSDRRMPDTPSVLLDIRSLQSSYTRRASTHEADKAKRILTLISQYDRALDRLQRKSVSSSKLDDAKAIQEERKRVSSSESVKQAKAAMKQRSATPSPQIPEPKAQEKKSREEEATLLAWCDDYCEVYHNGKRVAGPLNQERSLTIREGDIIAVIAKDRQAGAAGALVLGLKLVANGKAVGTDTSWVYTQEETKGWKDPEFNAKRWRKVK